MIDLNKKYRTRDGRRETEQLIHRPGNGDDFRIIALFTDGTSLHYHEDGTLTGRDDELDLIPIDEPTTADLGTKVTQVKTLWDEYALAAMPHLMKEGTRSLRVAYHAAAIADEMMKEREERGIDAL